MVTQTKAPEPRRAPKRQPQTVWQGGQYPGVTPTSYRVFPQPEQDALASPVTARIMQTGRQALSTAIVISQVEAITTLNESPAVSRYKAEVLDWLNSHPNPYP